MNAHSILDHLTDVVAIGAIAAIVLYGGTSPEEATLVAITSIALGKRYLDMKGGV